MDFRLGYESRSLASVPTLRRTTTGTTGAATAGTTVRSTFTAISWPRSALTTWISLSFFFFMLLTFFYMLCNFRFFWFFGLLFWFLFVRESFNYFFRFISIDCYDSELKLEWIFCNVFKNFINFGSFVIVYKNTPHKSWGFLIDVNTYIFDWPILVKSFSNIFIGKIPIDIFNIKTWVFF